MKSVPLFDRPRVSHLGQHSLEPPRLVEPNSFLSKPHGRRIELNWVRRDAVQRVVEEVAAAAVEVEVAAAAVEAVVTKLDGVLWDITQDWIAQRNRLRLRLNAPRPLRC